MFRELLHLLDSGKAANRRDINAARKIVHKYIRTALETLGSHLSNTANTAEAELSEVQESTDGDEATSIEEALCVESNHHKQRVASSNNKPKQKRDQAASIV